MKPKTYISLLLLVLFVGKVLSVDARGFTLFLENEEISLINKICKRGHLQDASDLEQDQHVQNDENRTVLEVDFLCQTPVQLKETSVEFLAISENYKSHFYVDAGPPNIHSDRFYPPPRV